MDLGKQFVERFKYWQKELGLTSWKFVYAKEKKDIDGYATINYDWRGRHFWLYYNFDENVNIDDVALHECLHLLLADANIDNTKVEHEIVYRLTNMVQNLLAEGIAKMV